ncbi:MATE family efflux transporter [Paraglaciecola polaris]|uniref:Multidrug-efflux transporter n=1 Tax=Paraglaciecola polaris LMG 21857 TaxID=1129793 RepID=K6ZCQ6_9ALTE|nr:MATE family efflux transporter [Paraglaciecola polaris]GAC33851.1 multidrug resistance protein norM [Paraglaciecola polaris LMG 21857]
MTLKIEFKALAHLAWPLLIAQVTQTLMGVSDTIMAGRFSATDMAAVAIGFSFTMPMLFFIQGLTLALPPIISRFNGAKQIDKVANASYQVMWLALFFAVLALVLSTFLGFLFSLIEMEPELRIITIDYVRYVLYSMPAFALYQVLRNVCEGLSITKPSMIIMIIGLLVNIPANYVFIYGKLGIPAFGGAGCGIATGLVFVAMMFATWIYTLNSKKLQKYALYTRIFAPNLHDIWASLKLGLPIALTILFEVTLFTVVAVLLAPFGSTIVAAHQVALNFSSLMFMLPLSLGMATSIRVSHLLGESKPLQAKMATRAALLMGLTTATLTATMTYLARVHIGELYSNNAEVINMAASLMLLAALFQFSDAIQVVSATALRGYKDTAAMFYLSFISYWVIGMTIGCVLALTDWIVPRMAAAGFWIGFICGLTSAAILLGLRLRHIQRKQENMPVEMSI